MHEGFPNHALDINVCSLMGEDEDSTAVPSLRGKRSPTETVAARMFLGSTFKVDKRPFPVMNGRPHHIHLVDNATPYACHTPIPIPKHWEKGQKTNRRRRKGWHSASSPYRGSNRVVRSYGGGR